VPDVEALHRLREAGVPALLYGPPGTGKTSLVEAAFPGLITVAAERERQRGDEGEPAGDLASPDAGEQALALQVDPREDERGGYPFGEVLEGAGDFGAAAGWSRSP